MRVSPCANILLGTVVLFLLVFSAAADTPSIKVTVNRNRIYLGESVIMDVSVADAGNESQPDVSRLEKCNTRFLGRHQQSNYGFSITINGVTRSGGFSGSIYSYEITPTQVGDIVLGPVSVKVGSILLSDQGPTVTVTGIEKQDLVSIAVVASRDTVLVDEPFEVKLTVRIRQLPGRYADYDPLFPESSPTLTVPFVDTHEMEGLRGPDIRQLLQSRLLGRGRPGFAINNYTAQNDPFDFDGFFNMGNPFEPKAAVFGLDKQKVAQNGKTYFEYSLSMDYQPQEEGTYTFGPVVFKGQVPVEVNAQGQASGTEVFAVGPAATVRVIPPPEENRPVSYIGALGSNLTAEASLDAQTCNIGDPLKLTLTIGGPIQMRNVFPPRLSLQTNLASHFEIYDDNVRVSKKDSSVQFAYTLRPRNAGAFELPPIALSYYDVTERRYKTFRTLPIPLKVRQAVEVTASQIIGNTTNPPPRRPLEDLRTLTPAGLRLDKTGPEPSPLLGNPPALGLAAGLGPVLFFLALGVRQLANRREFFSRSLRRRRAFEKALRFINGSSRQDPSPDPHLLLCKAMRQYLVDRLDLPASAATPDDVRRLLTSEGIPPETVQRFAAAMECHFNSAFGAGSDPASKQAVDEVKQAIAALENATGGHAAPPSAGKTAAVAMLISLTVAAAAPTASAATSAERQFMWNEANARFMAAKTPEDYLGAADAYQKLVDLGVRNSAVFFNFGTALLLATRYDDAVQVLLRAERYDGGSKDIAQNLGVARAKRDKVKTPVVPWNRVALFWHFDLPCSTRAWIAVIAFSLLWVALACRLAGWQRGFGTVMTVGILALALFGSSVLATLQIESASRRPILMAPLAPPSPPAP